MPARKSPCLLCDPITYIRTSGTFDFEFMDYTVAVLQKCKEYGFKVYMDPHQDVVRATCYILKFHHANSRQSGHGSPAAPAHLSGLYPLAVSIPQASWQHKQPSSTPNTPLDKTQTQPPYQR